MKRFIIGNNRGMTFVEMIVVVSLFTIMMLAISTSVADLYRYNAHALAQAYQLDLARRGIEVLTRDLREMIFSEDGAFPLVRMEPHVVGFYSDVDGDDSVEYVEYELSTTTRFTKRIYAPTGSTPAYNFATATESYVVSEYVQNLIQATSTFLYFTNTGSATTASSAIADIRFIRSQIIVNVDQVHNPGEYMLRSGATLRNLKDNL